MDARVQLKSAEGLMTKTKPACREKFMLSCPSSCQGNPVCAVACDSIVLVQVVYSTSNKNRTSLWRCRVECLGYTPNSTIGTELHEAHAMPQARTWSIEDRTWNISCVALLSSDAESVGKGTLERLSIALPHVRCVATEV